jgi:hypothetical protein
MSHSDKYLNISGNKTSGETSKNKQTLIKVKFQF